VPVVGEKKLYLSTCGEFHSQYLHKSLHNSIVSRTFPGTQSRCISCLHSNASRANGLASIQPRAIQALISWETSQLRTPIFMIISRFCPPRSSFMVTTSASILDWDAIILTSILMSGHRSASLTDGLELVEERKNRGRFVDPHRLEPFIEYSVFTIEMFPGV
jgi:hypothetical protein